MIWQIFSEKCFRGIQIFLAHTRSVIIHPLSGCQHYIYTRVIFIMRRRTFKNIHLIGDGALRQSSRLDVNWISAWYHNYNNKKVIASLCKPPQAQVHLVAKTSSLILNNEFRSILFVCYSIKLSERFYKIIAVSCQKQTKRAVDINFLAREIIFGK